MSTIELPKSGASLNRHRSKQDYQTPVEFIEAVEKRFGKLAVDLAASEENAKAPIFIDKQRDSLTVNWSDHKHLGLLWLNCPFGNISPWAKKCYEESRKGARILFLVPASVGSNWFAEYVHGGAAIFFLRPRLSFDGKNPFPKDCLLAYFGSQPGFWCWKWK